MTSNDRTGAAGWLKRRFAKRDQPLVWLGVFLAGLVACVLLAVFGSLSDGITGALVIATFAYVVFTSRILKTTRDQARLAQNPVVGIHIDEVVLLHPQLTLPAMGASPGDFVVFLALHGLGTGPALDLVVDGEVSLHSIRLVDQSALQCRYTRTVDFLPAGEDTGGKAIQLVWGYRLAEALLQDLNMMHGKYREETERGRIPLRAATDDDPILMYALMEPKVTIRVVYTNNLEQNFESVLETHIGCEEPDSVLEHHEGENLQCVVHRAYAKPFSSQPIDDATAKARRVQARGIVGPGCTASNREMGSTEQAPKHPLS